MLLPFTIQPRRAATSGHPLSQLRTLAFQNDQTRTASTGAMQAPADNPQRAIHHRSQNLAEGNGTTAGQRMTSLINAGNGNTPKFVDCQQTAFDIIRKSEGVTVETNSYGSIFLIWRRQLVALYNAHTKMYRRRPDIGVEKP